MGGGLGGGPGSCNKNVLVYILTENLVGEEGGGGYFWTGEYLVQ